MGSNLKILSHLDLFGNFAIGLDALEARHIGILPTIYYYKDWPNGQDLTCKKLASGLCSQLINRLDEIRNILSILSHIEAIASDESTLLFPSREKLFDMGITPKFETAVQSRLNRLTPKNAKYIFSFFDTDRVASWNLVDYIKMLFSFYQTVDSSLCDEPLVFFQQREWRLIHHMRKGLQWFCLGNCALFADSSRYKFRQARNDIRRFLESRLGRLNEDRMVNFWVIAEVDNKPFREMIREIVVPIKHVDHASALINRFTYYGSGPEIKYWDSIGTYTQSTD